MGDHLCACCPVLRPADAPRIPDVDPVCNGCRRSVSGWLAELPDLYALIDPTPGKSSTEKVSGSREAPLPLRVDPLDLTLPARLGSIDAALRGQLGDQDQVGHLSVATELDFWVRDFRAWRERGEGLPDPDVSSMTNWLLNRLDDLFDHPAIDEFCGAILRLVRVLRSTVAPGSSRDSAGRCPALLRDDTRCNARLSVDPYADVITCGRCGSSWNRRDQGWMKLRAQQAEWEAEAA